MNQQRIEALLAERAYNPEKPPPPDQVVLRIEGKNIGSLGNFITISGLPKRGKGKFTAAIIAGALTGEIIWGIHTWLPPEKRKIAFFDTDQSRYDFYKNIELIKQLAGLEKQPENLFAFNVRKDEPNTIANMVEVFTRLHPDTGIVVIDNIGDLLNNFNDEGQSKKLINYLKRITDEKNILVINTLHLGKSNNSTIGHLGAMSDRYAQSTLACEKIENNYILKLKDSRTAGDFTPISIFYDEYTNTWKESGWVPEQDEKIKPLKPKPVEIEEEIHRRNVRRIFSIENFLQYSELIEEIKQTYAVGTNWAKQCVIHLLDIQLIFKTTGGYTNQRKQKLYAEK